MPYSHSGPSWDREGRSCLLGDEPLKSLSFPVSNLQSSWKGPLGNILTRCCVRGPEAEAPLGWQGHRTGSWAGWCLPSLQHPCPHLEGQPIPTCGLLQGRHSTHSTPCPGLQEHPGALGAARAQLVPRVGTQNPCGCSSSLAVPSHPVQLMLVPSSHYLVNLLVSLLADDFFQDFPVPLNEPARQAQPQEP